MNRKLQIVTLAAAGTVAAGIAAESGAFSYKPKEGFVPTKEVAIRIAVAVWEPIYGEEHIASKKPYHARLTNGVWVVEGSLPAGTIGGAPQAEISKGDGRILRVSHGQ